MSRVSGKAEGKAKLVLETKVKEDTIGVMREGTRSSMAREKVAAVAAPEQDKNDEFVKSTEAYASDLLAEEMKAKEVIGSEVDTSSTQVLRVEKEVGSGTGEVTKSKLKGKKWPPVPTNIKGDTSLFGVAAEKVVYINEGLTEQRRAEDAEVVKIRQDGEKYVREQEMRVAALTQKYKEEADARREVEKLVLMERNRCVKAREEMEILNSKRYQEELEAKERRLALIRKEKLEEDDRRCEEERVRLMEHNERKQIQREAVVKEMREVENKGVACSAGGR